MNIAIYARVSTQDQSCEMQLRELRQYAAQRGFTIYKEYIDHGQSGSKMKRPELDALMYAAGKRFFDGVLVWRFDRFARSTKHLVDALAEFRRLGISFLSYSENIDTNSPIGEAIFTIISAMAQLERDIIRERVLSGLSNAVANGKVLGRPRRIDEDQRADIVEFWKQGFTVREISQQMKISARSIRRNLPQKQASG